MIALGPCPDCKRHARLSDPVCPFCGSPTLRTAAPSPLRVAKLTRAAVFFAGAVSLAACGGSEPAQESPAQEPDEDPQPQPENDVQPQPDVRPDTPAPPYGAPPDPPPEPPPPPPEDVDPGGEATTLYGGPGLDAIV